MDHGILRKDQFEWDSIPMGDGQMLNSLDYIDSFIRTRVAAYFEQLLIKLSFRRRLLKKEINLSEGDVSDGELDDWEVLEEEKEIEEGGEAEEVKEESKDGKEASEEKSDEKLEEKEEEVATEAQVESETVEKEDE